MEFIDRLNSVAAKVRNERANISTEEGTKNAFVMPFLSTVLGYDVFDPNEVIPEFTADVGVKKGEKIDYAITRDGEIQILVECKKVGEPLNLEHASQLFRYFAVTNARIALLTNGQVYDFYTDLDARNKMDSKPFLELDLADIDPAAVPEIAKMTKESFNLDAVVSAAEELMYVSQIKREIASEFKSPSDDWVKFFTTRVSSKAFTQKIREQFTALVAKASAQFLNDRVNSRLKTALGAEDFTLAAAEATMPRDTDAEVAASEQERSNGIITTTEERQGFAIVKAIGCRDASPERITGRDAKSYFAIFLDDNNRKPLARLHFNGTRKFIGVFDSNKKETRHPIKSLDEIYHHADTIRESVKQYL